MKLSILAMMCLGAFCPTLVSAQAVARHVPSPLPEHPGNIFLAGEEVVVPVSGSTQGWRLVDYDDKPLVEPRGADGRLQLGQLPIGFYRLQRGDDSNWVSLAVLARLKSPTPLQSPIALDVAMAWFYGKEKMEAVSSLCALAGVNWVRDRLAWGQMEPKKGQWSGPNRYDDSARAQAAAGLQVLQVNHSSPSWANAVTKRFPPDLRDAYRFHREMARRWRGQVLAFEPWNEADIPNFGGHTGSEMASMQKASWLGLKAGNPEVIACLNVFALHNRAQLADLHDNEAWPYFDTFNLHHYAPFDDYPRLYADFRAVSAGRPLWVTEFALPVKWAGPASLQEPTVADSRLLSERVAKAFAASLHEGSVASFYFLLPHYVEGQTQFGILRRDLTPRPAYVAVAAVGRWLANARPLGRLTALPEGARAFLFHAQPDGQNQNVLVAWTSKGEAILPLPVAPSAVLDHLGRPLSTASPLRFSTAPLLVILPEGSHQRLALEPAPALPARLSGTPSLVVLQTVWPEEKTTLSKSAYKFPADRSAVLPLFVYNFSEEPVRGRLSVNVPEGWQARGFDQVDLAPQARTELRLEMQGRPASSTETTVAVRITGDFGQAGRPVLSVRLLPEPSPASTK